MLLPGSWYLLPSHTKATKLHKDFLAGKGARRVKSDEGLEFKDVDAQTSDSDMEELVKKPLPMEVYDSTL